MESIGKRRSRQQVRCTTCMYFQTTNVKSNETTKQTMWGLPEVFDIVEAEDLTSSHERMQSVDPDESDPQVDLEIVEGHPDWRRVTKEDTVYFFNVVTRETAWQLE